jgi:hypothetical protein
MGLCKILHFSTILPRFLTLFIPQSRSIWINARSGWGIFLAFPIKIHYNLDVMIDFYPSTHLMRVLLVGCAIAMVCLAAFFLRSRKLSVLAYLGWGVIAILLPVLGPFLVIWMGPGEERDHNTKTTCIP